MDTFEDFAKNSSIHGVKYLVIPTSRFERLFWIVVLISSLTFAGYLTSLFWTRYTSNPTRTTLKTAFAPTTTVAFPALTICNRNKLLRNRVDKFITKLEGNEEELVTTRNMFSDLLTSELVTENKINYNATDIEVAQNVLDRNDYSHMPRIIRRVSQRCEDLLIGCAWNKKLASCKDIFKESFTPDGRCCSFNYLRKNTLEVPVHTRYYGLFNGLRVVLKPDYSNIVSAGASVIIHRPKDYAGAHQNIRKHLPLGRVNYVQIEGSKRECSEEVKELPISHRQCVYSEEKKLRYFSTYADSNCMSECEALLVFKLCGCVPYYFDFVDDKPICNLLKLPCLQDIANVSTDSCDCPSQCEDEFYDVTMTSAKFVNNPEVWLSDYLNDINGTEKSILLNIFFSNNRQTIWWRDTMTSGIYLISSFGGIYSLFLGCSIITIIEILYYCFGKCVPKTICPKREIDDNEYGKQLKKVNFEDDKTHTISKRMKEQNDYFSYPVIPFVN